MLPVGFMAYCLTSSTVAPRNEILINLACAYHRPDHYTAPASPAVHSTLSTLAIKIASNGRGCSSDPLVLRVVGKLVTVQSLVTGLLTGLTAGWWGQMSDQYGRKLILVTTVLGTLMKLAIPLPG
ncbi:hypothetical protein FRB94_009974 [Tulasnella sp. JGI-2019a]|nr:hypothetical protein FRB94_009974 [Tulasnella sp. JGI-2019a]